MRDRPIFVAIVKEKGGCGATTAVQAIAAGLQHRGFKVLVVDVNAPIHSAFVWFLERQKAPPERIEAAKAGKKLGHLVVEATEDFTYQDGDWDFILFDLPGGVTEEAEAALQHVDFVVTSFKVTFKDFNTRRQLFERIQRAVTKRGRPLPTLVIMQMVPRGQRYQLEIEEIAREFPSDVRLLGQLRHSTDWYDADTRGLTPPEFQPGGAAAADAIDIAKRFLRETKAHAA